MSPFQRIIAVVQSIPRGRVASYGQVAAVAGMPRSARMVGWALHGLTEEALVDVPWHRVVNRKGEISTTCTDHTALVQKKLLQKEGVAVSRKENVFVIDLKRFGT